ncbi:MAG: class I SAM-dependent methyltransferase [Candidatus Omnitrophota bacterium]|jgi:2-polyprenyl-3-methyl-5-hydroxy-6-metoxy-1,4-benzoquinol methylase|nr:class I SAM-dependent methyltransferase [Candidatus Neomarinimicrobiota bacterium]
MIEYIQKPCPVCHNNHPESMRFIESNGEVNRILCKACDTIYFDHTPPVKPIYDLKYNMHFFRPGDIRKAGIMAAKLGELANVKFQKPNILEVGAGNGLTVLLLRAQGFNAFGLDLDQKLAQELKIKYNIPIVCAPFEDFNPPGKYHLIYSSHVIEHTMHPNRFMKKAFDLLEAGGLFCLDTPDTYYQAAASGRWHHFETRNPYEHCCLLGDTGIRILAAEAGFEVVRGDRFDAYQSIQFLLSKPEKGGKEC